MMSSRFNIKSFKRMKKDRKAGIGTALVVLVIVAVIVIGGIVAVGYIMGMENKPGSGGSYSTGGTTLGYLSISVNCRS